MLRIVSIDNDPSIRIAVDGPLTSENVVASPAETLGALLGAGWARHRIVVDMSKADHIDSSAIGWLLNCHRALESAGGSMVLHSVQPNVLRILRMLKIESILPIVEDEEAATATTEMCLGRHAA